LSLSRQIDQTIVVLSIRLVASCHLGRALETAKAGIIAQRLLLLGGSTTRVELGHLHTLEHVVGWLLLWEPTLASEALGLEPRLSLRLLACRVKVGLPLLLRWLLGLRLAIHVEGLILLLGRAIEELGLESTSLAWLLHLLLGPPTKRISLRLGLLHHVVVRLRVLALVLTVKVSHHLEWRVFRIGRIGLGVLVHHIHNVANLLLLELLLIRHTGSWSRSLASYEVRESVIPCWLILDWSCRDKVGKLVILDNGCLYRRHTD